MECCQGPRGGVRNTEVPGALLRDKIISIVEPLDLLHCICFFIFLPRGKKKDTIKVKRIFLCFLYRRKGIPHASFIFLQRGKKKIQSR